MSVAFADYDNDGLTDVFVTNDNLPNFLFHNRGDGTFEEVALQAGVALTNNGVAGAGKGGDLRQYDNDRRPPTPFTALPRGTFPPVSNVGNEQVPEAAYHDPL